MVYPEIAVVASDVSAEALEIARANVARHRLDARITLIESDLFARLPGRYDLVLCNPPYVSDASMAALPAEYRAEPALALAGGADGMDLIRRILAEAPVHMTDQAVLVLEVGHERAHFERAFPRLECAWLETSGGDDHVVLVERRALRA
jgi:ribosomal protein L3 glutamine methyltransferase